MVDIDTSRKRAGQFTVQLLERSRILERVITQDAQQALGLRPESGRGKLTGVLPCFFREYDLTSLQPGSPEQDSMEVFRLSRMDSLIPGTDSR